MIIKYENVPKSSFVPIDDAFKSAIAVVKEIIEGKASIVKEGPFQENGEILPFMLMHISSIKHAPFDTATKVYEKLQLILRNVAGNMTVEEYLPSAIMALYGFLLGEYSDEEFRHVYRYALTRVRELGLVEKWIRKAVLFISACEKSEPREVMSRARSWIKFLGATTPNPFTMIQHASALGLDFEELMNEEDYRLVNTIRRYPTYLIEALGDRKYNDVYLLTSEWLPDLLQSELLSIYRKQIEEELSKEVNSTSNVEDAIELAKKYFKREKFYTNKKTVLPVRLHEIPSPPPAEVMDTDAFEIVPPKLRKTLLPIMCYSTSTKKIEIIFLGGPRIGHSSILIKTDTGGILMDYGLSVANQTIPEWVPEIEMIDTVLVTHSHLDHIGGLPVLYEKYDGKWCSTATTGAITKVLLEDALNVGTPHLPRKKDRWDGISRFKKGNIDKVMKNHISLDVGRSYEVSPGIVVTLIDACHIPGSVAYLVDIEGKKILYTGDFNIDKSIMFQGARMPNENDIMIFDGTYWAREDFDRGHVKNQLVRVTENFGPVIIPSFAVGRSQEILLLLEELRITESRNVIVAGMTEKITKLAGYSGNWNGIKKNKVTLDKEDILVAGGGMMSGGLALQYFREHQYNEDAAVVLCGYLAPRTTGWNLLKGYEPHECHVIYARLSAHSSASNLEQYIKSCKGTKVMVHTPFKRSVRGLKIPDYRERIIIDI